MKLTSSLVAFLAPFAIAAPARQDAFEPTTAVVSASALQAFATANSTSILITFSVSQERTEIATPLTSGTTFMSATPLMNAASLMNAVALASAAPSMSATPTPQGPIDSPPVGQIYSNTSSSAIKPSGNFTRLEKRRGSNHLMAAWVYLADDSNYNQIPLWWADMDFSQVDILYIAPAGVLGPNRRDFGFAENTYDSYRGSMITRLEFIMRKYRAVKRNGKVIMSQWYGDGTGVWGRGVDVMNPNDLGYYAGSVGAFIERYVTSPDANGYTGPIDGWDIDFEGPNVTPNGANVMNVVRGQLNWLQNKWNRGFWVTASPTGSEPNSVPWLASQKDQLTWVNMQTYAGSVNLKVDTLTAAGIPANKLFFGACPEDGGCLGSGSRSYGEITGNFTSKGLAGVHSYRLNSNQGRFQYERDATNQLAAYVHNQNN